MDVHLIIGCQSILAESGEAWESRSTPKSCSAGAVQLLSSVLSLQNNTRHKYRQCRVAYFVSPCGPGASRSSRPRSVGSWRSFREFYFVIRVVYCRHHCTSPVCRLSDWETHPHTRPVRTICPERRLHRPRELPKWQQRRPSLRFRRAAGRF